MLYVTSNNFIKWSLGPHKVKLSHVHTTTAQPIRLDIGRKKKMLRCAFEQITSGIPLKEHHRKKGHLVNQDTEFHLYINRYVAVPSRNRTLFHCVFQLCWYVPSAKTLLPLRAGLIRAM